MVSLKCIAYGISFCAWVDYFQIGESTILQSLNELTTTLITCNDPAVSLFLKAMTKQDIRRITQLLHLEKNMEYVE